MTDSSDMAAGTDCIATSCSLQLEECNIQTALGAAIRGRQAAEQQLAVMSKEVTALKVSNHDLLRSFNRDWRSKALVLAESERLLNAKNSELQEQIDQLQAQAAATKASKGGKLSKAPFAQAARWRY
jgi:hypothetical protein